MGCEGDVQECLRSARQQHQQPDGPLICTFLWVDGCGGYAHASIGDFCAEGRGRELVERFFQRRACICPYCWQEIEA